MKTSKKKSIALILVLTLIVTAFPIAASAQQQLPVSNINMVLRGDSSQAIHLNYKTTTLANTAVVYSEVGEPLDENATRVPAQRTNVSKVGYHKVSLENLTPDTTYQYAIVDVDSGQMSEQYQFKTSGSSEESFNFISTADGTYRTTPSYQNNWGNTVRTALNQFPESKFIVHSGEYGSSTGEKYMDGFLGQINDILTGLPIVPATMESSSANNAFNYNYNLNKTGSNTDDYSFVYKNARFVVINTKLTSTAEMAKHSSFLQAEKAQADANGEWIIAVIGDSFYGNSSNSSSIKKKLELEFSKIGVSLVLQGKGGVYSRSYPITGGSILNEYPAESQYAKKDGTVYLNPGPAGAEYTARPSSSASWVKATKDCYSTSADRKDPNKKSYSNIEVNDNEIIVSSYLVNGEKIDEFRIYKGETPELETRYFAPLALNNNFGDGDSKTERRINWQIPTDLAGKFALTGSFVDVTDSQGVTTRYSDTTINKMPSPVSKRYVSNVDIDGLTAGETYSYRVGHNFYSNASNYTYTFLSEGTYEFTTAPESDDPYTFIHFADSQSDPVGAYEEYFGYTLDAAEARVPDAPFALHTGDMIESNSNNQWTSFMRALDNHFTSKAFLPMAGNHEGSTGAKVGEAAFGTNADNGFKMNYSFTYGNARYINLNMNHMSSSELKKQATWVRGEVQGHEDKFIIVSFHRAPYGGRHAGGSELNNLRKYLVPELNDMGVDLVLGGHDHNYIRSYPVKAEVSKGTLVPVLNRDMKGDTIATDKDGTLFITGFNSGKKTYTKYNDSGNSSAIRNRMAKQWALTSTSDMTKELTSYITVTVDSDKLSVNAYWSNGPASIRVDGELIDSFTIYKNAASMEGLSDAA